MTSRAMADLIRQWFARAGQATGPILPDGWFGRPYDNSYILKDIQIVGDVLVIKLSEDTSLTLEQLGQVYIDNSELVFEGFHTCLFRWKEYGGIEDRELSYDAGLVRFVPPVGTTVTL